MEDIFIKTSGTNGVVLQEYQGKFSLASAWEGRDGKTVLRWAKEQVRRDEYAEKSVPIKVQLGDSATAAHTLRFLADQIEPLPPVPEDEKVPF